MATDSQGFVVVQRKGARGGKFDDLPSDVNAAPGQPAHSAEGWVIFASNLDPSTTEENLKDFFSNFGKIHVCKYLVDASTCRCMGSAAIEFLDYQSALNAVTQGNGVPFVNDRPINICFAFVVPEPDEELEALDAAVMRGTEEHQRRERDAEANAALQNMREELKNADEEVVATA